MAAASPPMSPYIYTPYSRSYLSSCTHGHYCAVHNNNNNNYYYFSHSYIIDCFFPHCIIIVIV